MTTAISERPQPAKTAKINRQNIPQQFVREVIDGIPFYYPGFREAIKKHKKVEEIMPDSFLQSIIKNIIGDFLKAKLNRKLWMVLAGETGSHININNNLGLDIVVFEKAKALNQRNLLKYSNIPPFLVIEVDVNVELPDPKSDLFHQYVVPKINRLFAFGTQKVVWVFTKSKKVLSATPTQPWQFFNLNDDVLIMEKVKMNVAKMIEAEGINPDISF